MCCRSLRCFRTACACICVRCRSCDQCFRAFGKGDIAITLAEDAVGRLGRSIVSSGRPSRGEGNPFLAAGGATHGDTDYTARAPAAEQHPRAGTAMVKEATKSCKIQ